ncbi:AAA family ATPase [Pseudoalteromonas sp. Hal040]|uniref:AAA family ATPase n=1 Tax=unclassified Pseudoalteromonas TaxID=194690 RepID=UPI00301C8C22
MLRFIILNRSEDIPSSGANTCYLIIDNWNDFSFITSFYLSIHDEGGTYHKIGGVKIGFFGQTEQESTEQALRKLSLIEELPSSFFSLGIGSEYYHNLSTLNESFRNTLMVALRDVVFNSELIKKVENERVFKISLLREASISVIEGKYKRFLYGDNSNISFHFAFHPTLGEFGNKLLKFKVVKKPQPSLTTNVHALIGRNGTGKTTLLNKIVRTALSPRESLSHILDLEATPLRPIPKNYFSSIVSVSFSSFDLEAPPLEQRDPSKGTCYSYIGLKKPGSGQLKTLNERRIEMCESLFDCFHNAESLLNGDNKKRDRFWHAVKLLSSDYSIKSFGLETLWDEYNCIFNDFMREEVGAIIDPVEIDKKFRKTFTQKFLNLLPDMSSGHAIVLMTTFSLISKVDEKSLVLIDEPESHLHPLYYQLLFELFHG